MSPSRVTDGKRWHLSVPFECSPEQRQPDTNVVAVDLGLNTTATVCVVSFDGTLTQQPWWNNQRGWQNLLNNLRLMIQPLICFNGLKRWLGIFPMPSLQFGFAQITHQMNAFICPLVHQWNQQRVFSST
ncbi:hypothetical protein KV190_04315 [Thermosynechococcus sp. FA-CM-4201]